MKGPMRTRILAAVLLLAGCADADPYLKPGMWQPTGANALNLAAMVANPHDLIRGRGDRGASGWEATPPVSRLWAGAPTPLPSSGSQAAVTGPAAPAIGTGATATSGGK